MCCDLVSLEKGIFFIDEPEANLHPEALRRLLTFIRKEKPESQFIITSHSSVVLDSAISDRNFRVSLDANGETEVEHIAILSQAHSLLDELGARPSDLLQANYVIWVEGPSDRLFFKRCLSLICTDLNEGLHFSFAFYGGSCLAWHSAEPSAAEVGQFINILLLCRNAGLISDSDRDRPEGPLKDRVSRVKRELTAAGRYCWVLDEREVENAIPRETLSAFIFARSKNHSGELSHIEPFEKIDEYLARILKEKAFKYSDDKVEYMSRIVKLMTKDHVISSQSLVSQIKELGLRIAKASGIQVSS